ncbi:nucleotidyltransferase domain-containing protein [Lentzea jiangxiensis]|uniref:Streptomycin 3-adenylyltransferase n=1 Tax=Lentzea jiangxiensis TaxID=641025 RepID=A0A1H0R128_9PSEU|nr:nucleotidyltransferase domain-containing protein [Lentzea jiangxiensis]SDP23055.1 streptomycin 3-adenylyltransferase [Lentzea jiangxiensis]
MITPGEYLSFLDARLPGLVAGAHLYGSRVLDDVVADSDLDIVVELSSPAEVPGFEGADVAVVPAGSLEKPVSAVTPLAGEITPVLWQQLRTVGQTVRGTRPTCPVTAAEVEDYCRGNLVSYWTPLFAQVRAVESLPRDGILWVGLGPARLWHTIRTGDIVSKSRAGELAAARWPDLPLADIVAARRDPSVELGASHTQATIDLFDRILTDVTT